MTIPDITVPVSYDLDGAAAATGLSERTLRDDIARGDLIAHYGGKGKTKPLIEREDLIAYIRSLPTERKAA